MILTKQQLLKIIYPNRYDIAVKWAYAKFILKEIQDTDAESLYVWHIEKRTRGIEPGSLTKRCVSDYLNAYAELIISMKTIGYDEKFAIKIDSHYGLHGGAHRLACSLALNIPIIATEMTFKKKPRSWDYEWFVNRSLDAKRLSKLEGWMQCLLTEINFTN